MTQMMKLHLCWARVADDDTTYYVVETVNSVEPFAMTPQEAAPEILAAKNNHGFARDVRIPSPGGKFIVFL